MGKDDKDNLEHPDYLALVAKWDAFLVKLDERFSQSLGHAEEAVLANLIASDYDTQPTMQAWSGIKAQLRKLGDKIDQTFDDKVQPQMLEYVERWDIIDQDQKGVKLSEAFTKRLQRFEIELEGKVARAFYDHAIQFLNEEFRCTQCGGELQINKDLFRAHYVSCDYCNTVNTFMPNDKIAELAWCADDIAKHKALTEWDKKEAASEACSEICERDDDEQNSRLRQAYDVREKAELAFWKKYFTERALLCPQYKETIDHDIDVKMKLFFYDDRKRSALNY